MTLPIILLYVGIASIILSLITVIGFKTKKNWITTFFQNYVGAFFIFSGWVKAVDPLGLAYKMEQYFAEFEATFADTWVSFLAPIFPFLSSMAVQFAVVMIVFEIILGIMLIIGAKPKFTSWAFLLLVAFFTFLTGFTYLTGYVPNGSNFFDFGSWAAYNKNNMRVTDCGCFGDFLKLEPKVSFFKDVILLIPAFYFIYKHKSFHTWFSPKVRTIILSASLIGLVIYCLGNYVTDIPTHDFRPFKKGADIASQKQAETDAQAGVQVLGFKLENKNSGDKLDVGYKDYLANLANYPSDEWSVTDQILGEPTIPLTKISDFDISDSEGHPVTDEILTMQGPYIMLVCHKLIGTGSNATRVIEDTIFVIDTVYNNAFKGGFALEKNVKRIDKKTVNYTNYIWKDHYAKRFEEVIKPFVAAASEEGVKTIAVIGGADRSMIEDFATDLELDIDYYTADDILLKTIVRSNPGIVLWEGGKILDKWHYKKLPNFQNVKKQHIE
ncbi:MAG: hypothetical protein V3V00_01255 [Saprospiraceae bacterium]